MRVLFFRNERMKESMNQWTKKKEMQILHGIRLRMESSLVGMKRRVSSTVACNIYVSPNCKERKETKQSFLVDILKAAQLRSKQLRETKARNNYKERQSIALIHAYTDTAYDRSSFHIAGTAENVVDVASFIAIRAIEAFIKDDDGSGSEEEDINKARHPTVGIVDHIAVMPLCLDDKNDAHGKAAREIGNALSRTGVHVIFYGSADTQNTPLATVRKQKTSFFKSGSLGGTSGGIGICTVGSPPSFVENFNIRLSKNVSKENAMLLTKKVRQRDGGVYGVEALTLPYTGNRYEVACNLLYPEKGTIDDIISKIDEWLQSFNDQNLSSKRAEYVEEAYRVGTTMKQCKDVLEQQESSLEQHDKNVLQNFIFYFEERNQT
jgi:glutamate formiminotransferase